MAQHLVEKKGVAFHDYPRTARMAAYGGCTSNTQLRPSHLQSQFHVFSSKTQSLTALSTKLTVIFGPAATTWYKFLQQRINLSSQRRTILARVAADQFVFTPINLTLFLSSMAALEGASPRERLESKYLGALRMNWTIWPPVQLANFSIVPLEHRVLVVNVVSLGELQATLGLLSGLF
jgi:protein Mpv17